MKTFFTIAALFCMQLLLGQAPGLRLLRSHPGPVAGVAIDNLGSVYLLSESGVKKLTPEGDSAAVFNGVRRYGKLTTADVSNPLRPLLFYQDFGQAVVLDRFLAVQATVDLRRAGVQQPAAAALSYDNKIWVFDALASKLKKLDESGQTLFETADLRQVFPDGLQPVQIFDHNNWVYLYDPAQGLFVFDYYGTFRRKVPVKGWQNLQVTDDAVVGFADGALQVYSLKTLMQTAQPLPEALRSCTGIKMGNRKLVALCDGLVQVYALNP